MTEISTGDPGLQAYKIRFEKAWDKRFFADPKIPEKKAVATLRDNAPMAPYLEAYRSMVPEVGLLQGSHKGCHTARYALPIRIRRSDL